MDRSIKEIVSGIVQRSVSIATQTTKELVLKDYAMESDETRIRNAAHLMVASLSGSLAHVTCKLENLLTSEFTEAEIQEIVAEVPEIILRCMSPDEAALAVAQKVFKGLYENESNNAHVTAHLAILASIRDFSKIVVKELTNWSMMSKWKDFLMEEGTSLPWTSQFPSCKTLLMNNSKVISELCHLVDALAKVAARPGSSESLQQLVEIAKNSAAVSDLNVGNEDNLRHSGDRK